MTPQYRYTDDEYREVKEDVYQPEFFVEAHNNHLPIKFTITYSSDVAAQPTTNPGMNSSQLGLLMSLLLHYWAD